MVWFYSGWVNGGGGQVVAKFLRGVVMGVEVAWWMGGVEQMTTARAGTSRKTGSAHVYFSSSCFCLRWGFCVLDLFCFVSFCFVLLGSFMCSFYILFVNCTQFITELFQKTDPARVIQSPPEKDREGEREGE